MGVPITFYYHVRKCFHVPASRASYRIGRIGTLATNRLPKLPWASQLANRMCLWHYRVFDIPERYVVTLGGIQVNTVREFANLVFYSFRTAVNCFLVLVIVVDAGPFNYLDGLLVINGLQIIDDIAPRTPASYDDRLLVTLISQSTV